MSAKRVLFLMVILTLLVAACATPEPETIIQTVEVEVEKTVIETVEVEVEKVVTEIVEVEKEVEKIVTVVVEVVVEKESCSSRATLLRRSPVL